MWKLLLISVMAPALMFLTAFILSIPLSIVQMMSEFAQRVRQRRQLKAVIKMYRRLYAEAPTDYLKGWYYGRAGLLELRRKGGE